MSSTKRASDEISVTGSSITESQEILKPLKEDRDMKFKRLDNGMKVLLVSDPTTTSAASCCYVRSGALNDTKQFQGLAHFCEHMLFLGTNNRPENTYTQYLTEHGG